MNYTTNKAAKVAETFTNWIKGIFGFDNTEDKIVAEAARSQSEIKEEFTPLTTDVEKIINRGKYTADEILIITEATSEVPTKDVDWITLATKLNRSVEGVKTKARALKK